MASATAGSQLAGASPNSATDQQVTLGKLLNFYISQFLRRRRDFFLKILFIHERHRERQRHWQREKQAPRREPDAGLDPGTPGSRPEPKADTQPLSHSGVPGGKIFKREVLVNGVKNCRQRLKNVLGFGKRRSPTSLVQMVSVS